MYGESTDPIAMNRVRIRNEPEEDDDLCGPSKAVRLRKELSQTIVCLIEGILLFQWEEGIAGRRP